MATAAQKYAVRKASEADVAALCEIHNIPEVHRRRLQPGGYSHHPDNCVLVVERDGEIIGNVHLVFVRPAAWPDAADTSALSCLIGV